jgi:hypothetical protein
MSSFISPGRNVPDAERHDLETDRRGVIAALS